MTSPFSHITRNDVMHYLFLPQIMPRLKGFKVDTGYIAYLMALIFLMTKLLPAGHVYTHVGSMGTFGIRDIFIAAKQNLKPDLKHIDHYIIYGSLLLGVGLFVAMVAILCFLLLTQAAHAAGSFTSMFTTPHPQKDIAFEMLDRVFQIPDLFGSQYMPKNWAEVTPFSRGLHAMFAFFSYGMLGIAGIIVMYFVFAVMLESAQSGTPFGKRFADFYAPIRLVIAILLLVPLGGYDSQNGARVFVGSGFSLGQTAVLYIAKAGSGLATNAWIMLNDEIAKVPAGKLSANEWVVRPNFPDLDDTLRFYALMQACRAKYEVYKDTEYQKDIKPYLIWFPQGGAGAEAFEVTSAMTFKNAFEKSGITSDLHIVYGDKNDKYDKALANVRPYCGHMRLSTSYTDEVTEGVKSIYFEMMKDMWANAELKAFADNWAAHDQNSAIIQQGKADAAKISADMQAKYKKNVDEITARLLQTDKVVKPVDQELLNRGWGGAGIWFNQIAETNGALMSAVVSTPQPVAYPRIMAHTMMIKRMTNPGTDTLSKFSPTFLGGGNISEIFAQAKLDEPAVDVTIAKFLGQAHDDLEKNNLFSSGREREAQNPIAGYINLVFGTQALFELRNDFEVHPLAKMSALGRGILDRALMYLGGSVVMSGLSGILSGTVDTFFQANGSKAVQFGAAFDQFAAALMAFALVGITVGFVLYYVVPMLPFMYFFFAVGRWVKGIFEAMVCIPLWALAHLRIDGDGIPGQAAANGYFIILELFLRPILTLFGLMAAISVFSAQALVLDMIFDLVRDNLASTQGGVDAAGKPIISTTDSIDQFFYIIVYAILIYIMALASFKLIDLIPNSIMRFMGSNVGAFSDKSAFEAEQTIQMTGVGGFQMIDDVAKAGQFAAKAAGQTVAAPAQAVIPGMVKEYREQQAKLAQPPPDAG